MNMRKLFIVLLSVLTIWSCSEGELEGDLYPVAPDKGNSGIPPVDNPVLKNLINNMKLIPGGLFWMGNNNDEGASPEHDVSLNRYYISKYEVSQKEWMAVMGQNPSEVQNGLNTDYPVTNVSYEDCLQFIKKLNELTQMEFSLPTEAQWEFAARGGSSSMYASNLFYYIGNSHRELHDVCPQNYEVEDYTNRYGLAHMSGNVAEWCADYASGYKNEYEYEPVGPKTGEQRIIRGGSCLMEKTDCAVYKRFSMRPNLSQSDVGFRLALKNLNQLKFSKSLLEFTKEGGTEKVEITTVDPVVEYSVDSSWVKLEKQGNVLTVKVMSNNVKRRTATIGAYCKSTGEYVSLPIKQEGLTFDIAYEGKMIDTLYIPWQGCSNQRLTVEQTKNVSWKVSCYSNDFPIWCWVEKQTSNSFTLSVNQNDYSTERLVWVTISENSLKMDDDILVIQSGAPYLSCTYNGEEIGTLTAKKSAATALINVSTNVSDWTVFSNSTSWCTIQNKTTESFTINVTALPVNLSFRETTVEVVADMKRYVITVKQNRLLQIGDLYDRNGVKGIVYQVNNDGSGMIVSLEEVSKNWSYKYSSTDGRTNATDSYSGEYNMRMIQNISGWSSNYPSFSWCYSNTGSGWYLPAKEELQELFRVVRSYGGPQFDKVLTDHGGQEFSSASDYWSSTEFDYEWAYTVNKAGTERNSAKKNVSYRVRAIRKVMFE